MDVSLMHKCDEAEDAEAMAEWQAQQWEWEQWQAASYEQWQAENACYPWQFEEGDDDEEEGEEAWEVTTTQIPTKIPRVPTPVPRGGRVGIHTHFMEGELLGAFGEVGVLSCFKGPPPSTVVAFGVVGVLSGSKGPPPSTVVSLAPPAAPLNGSLGALVAEAVAAAVSPIAGDPLEQLQIQAANEASLAEDITLSQEVSRTAKPP
eukprot:jgi/Chrpa1/14794/Chrysochromulina_OHIO_Genome00017679-RA